MSEIELEKIIASVQKNYRYAAMDKSLVESVARDVLKKGFSVKETVKRTRAKLHQVGGAYQERKIPYPDLLSQLAELPSDFHDPEVKEFCGKTLQFHRSTKERLFLLDTLYEDIFTQLPPVNSILDLACGLNPLTLPWMPVAEDATYFSCDVYPEMMNFVNAFMSHFSLPGHAFTCDLIQSVPQHEVDLALVFKTIPCLEQIDKSIGTRLLNQLNAKAVLVSFPVRSLSGRAKDMPRYYEEHFTEMLSQTVWKMEKISTIDELFFMLKK